MFPNFLIVGAPKAGTTSLYHYLKQHPEIFMSNPKELNFFSFEEIEMQKLYYKSFKVKTLKEYESFFRKGEGKKAIGEASVSYLYYPAVPKKIKNLLPDVKIIILLRNPIDRAFSHYLMDLRLGYTKLAFEDVVYKRVNHKYLNLFYQQYIEIGFYFQQVKRYIECFGKEQVKIILFEEMKNNTNEILLGVFKFLGVADNVNIDYNLKYNTHISPKNKLFRLMYRFSILRKIINEFIPKKMKNKIKNFISETQKPILKDSIREYLLSLYKNDILKLEIEINKDLSKWKTLR